MNVLQEGGNIYEILERFFGEGCWEVGFGEARFLESRVKTWRVKRQDLESQEARFIEAGGEIFRVKSQDL